MTGRIRLIVLFGGRSAEHEVSCVSAVSVLQALAPDRYEIVPVGITREGVWVAADETRKVLAGAGAKALPAAIEARGTEVAPYEVFKDVVVFPLLHGPFGEDGTVQGLCELAGVPYVGSGVLGSAVAMDKITSKRLLAEAGLPHARYIGLREHEIHEGVATRVGRELGWPVFVKPSNLGSSVGVTKVAEPPELPAALATALSYDEWVVIEEAIVGRELECAVLGDLDPQASVPGEIRPSHEFYDYDDKYTDGTAELVIPADLPSAVSTEVRRISVAAFRALRAEGMARVDFFYDAADRGVLVNEVNTIPGFTPISMYPQLWAASGMPYPELIDRLVQLAIERHQRRSSR